MTYPNIRQAQLKKELDRGTWAEPIQVVLTYETTGSGEIITGPIDFQGLVFDAPPLFVYGAELVPPSVLVTGRYPFISCGVSAWTTKKGGNDDVTYYTGADIWIKVLAQTDYHLLFQLAFEGVAFKNSSLFAR